MWLLLQIIGILGIRSGTILIIISGYWVSSTLRIIAVIECSSFLIMSLRPDWYPITPRIFGSHTLFSHFRWHYLFARCAIFNFLIGKHLICQELRGLRYLGWLNCTKYETNHVLLRVWKSKIIFNCFILDRLLSSSVRSKRPFKISSRTALVTTFTRCLNSIIMQFGMIYDARNWVWWKLALREAPITVIDWIKFSVLVTPQHL